VYLLYVHYSNSYIMLNKEIKYKNASQ